MRTGHPNRQCDQARNLPKIKSSSFCLLWSTHSLASSILIASSWSPLNRKIPFHIFKFRAKTFVYDISRQRVFVCYFRPPPHSLAILLGVSHWTANKWHWQRGQIITLNLHSVLQWAVDKVNIVGNSKQRQARRPGQWLVYLSLGRCRWFSNIIFKWIAERWNIEIFGL